MHLDTIFTRISDNEILIFPPILEPDYQKHLNKIYVYEKEKLTPVHKEKNLVTALKEDGLNVNFIKCGSDLKVMQEREQWTDGANAFTLSPGKIIILIEEKSEKIVSLFHVEECFEIDLAKVARLFFNTEDEKHPGVEKFIRKGNKVISGKLTSIENLKDEFKFSDQFSNRLLKISEKLGSNWRLRTTIKKGYQSSGNLLDNPVLEIAELKKKIEKQISIYRKNYKNSDDHYITRWPNESELNGWYVKLKKQGQLKSHIHENGWLSGVFYIKVPKPLRKNEGSINLSLQGFDYPYDKNLPNLYYAPKPFDLILYPSSLFHYTVPFTSNDERHCIAFDLTPKRSL